MYFNNEQQSQQKPSHSTSASIRWIRWRLVVIVRAFRRDADTLVTIFSGHMRGRYFRTSAATAEVRVVRVVARVLLLHTVTVSVFVSSRNLAINFSIRFRAINILAALSLLVLVILTNRIRVGCRHRIQRLSRVQRSSWTDVVSRLHMLSGRCFRVHRLWSVQVGSSQRWRPRVQWSTALVDGLASFGLA